MRRVSQQDRILPQNVGTSNEPKKKKKVNHGLLYGSSLLYTSFCKRLESRLGPKVDGGGGSKQSSNDDHVFKRIAKVIRGIDSP